jgi:hypothetical protein
MECNDFHIWNAWICHAGLVKNGWKYFDCMIQDFFHYTQVITKIELPLEKEEELPSLSEGAET